MSTRHSNIATRTYTMNTTGIRTDLVIQRESLTRTRTGMTGWRIRIRTTPTFITDMDTPNRHPGRLEEPRN